MIARNRWLTVCTEQCAGVCLTARQRSKRSPMICEFRPSAIRRALADAGLGFREAVDATRFDMARHYLEQRQLPLSEIALLLGYSELSAFTRAFTRWAGIQPTRLSQRHAAPLKTPGFPTNRSSLLHRLRLN